MLKSKTILNNIIIYAQKGLRKSTSTIKEKLKKNNLLTNHLSF